MRRGFLLLILVALIAVELVLLQGFFPYEWNHAVSQRLDRAFHVEPYSPHPHMDLEFEMVLRQHPCYRIALYLLTAVLMLGDGYLIAKTWKALTS